MVCYVSHLRPEHLNVIFGQKAETAIPAAESRVRRADTLATAVNTGSAAAGITFTADGSHFNEAEFPVPATDFRRAPAVLR